jgi:isoquinoline 1-oxidoreductase alpha subunit
MAFTLTINGAPQVVEAEGEMPLLWALRDILGLKATKFGCGAAFCGACTVHVDGTAMRSCQLPLASLGSKRITTLEGLAADPVGRRVKAAWAELDVIQCGYCQAGQIMSATALLKRNPKPTDAEIEGAMSGNICRCATYNRIRQAIRTAAGQEVSAAESRA